MAAATAGYNQEAFRDGYATIPSKSLSGAPQAPSPGPASSAPHPVQAIARNAGQAAAGAKDAVTELIAGPMPQVSLYTEPLNPATQLSLKDRAQMFAESCRPWAEFFDLKAFSRPAASELKLRVGHNFEAFFYNYLTVGIGFLGLFAVFHPLRAALLAFAIGVGFVVYILFPEDYEISEGIVVSTRMKHVVMAAFALLVLTVGDVFSLLFWVGAIVVPVCLVHACLREHSASVGDMGI